MSQTQELSPEPLIHLQILRSPGMTLSSDINKLLDWPVDKHFMSPDKILWFYSESSDWQYLPIILGPLGNYAPVISNQQGVDENHKRMKTTVSMRTF